MSSHVCRRKIMWPKARVACLLALRKIVGSLNFTTYSTLLLDAFTCIITNVILFYSTRLYSGWITPPFTDYATVLRFSIGPIRTRAFIGAESEVFQWFGFHLTLKNNPLNSPVYTEFQRTLERRDHNEPFTFVFPGSGVLEPEIRARSVIGNVDGPRATYEYRWLNKSIV